MREHLEKIQSLVVSGVFGPDQKKNGLWAKKGFWEVTRKIFPIGGMSTFDEQPPLFLPKTIEDKLNVTSPAINLGRFRGSCPEERNAGISVFLEFATWIGKNRDLD